MAVGTRRVPEYKMVETSKGVYRDSSTGVCLVEGTSLCARLPSFGRFRDVSLGLATKSKLRRKEC